MDFKDNVLKKLNTTNLFSVTYRKDKFAISDKEYPIGYTSFLVMDTDSRFIDESIFEDLKNFTEELLNKDFNRTDFLNYRAKIISVIDVLSQYEIFKILYISKIVCLYSYIIIIIHISTILVNISKFIIKIQYI